MQSMSQHYLLQALNIEYFNYRIVRNFENKTSFILF